MPDDSLHLTLAFLGEQPAPLATRLAQRVADMRLTPGQCFLNCWGHFPRSGIVWIGSARPCASLHALHTSLWKELEAQSIEGRPKAFVPHITLLRRAARPPDSGLRPPALRWRYNRLVLIQSVVGREGSRYITLARSASSGDRS